MTKPNILIFMTDQQRGSTVLPDDPTLTPNLDKLRRQGVTFEQTFCPSPHCCPSRATFQTGLYPTEHGVWNNVGVANTLSKGLNEGVRLWSQDLNEAGYELYFSGKWHVCNRTGPADYGWKEGFITAGPGERASAEDVWKRYRTAVTADEQNAAAAREEAQIVRPGYGTYTHYGVNENPFNDHDVVESSLQDLDRAGASGKPWCLYCGTLGPHDPYFVPQEFLDLYRLEDIELPVSFGDKMEDKPALYRRTRGRFDQLTEHEHREAIRHYRAFCTYQDWLFGKLMDALEKTGQAENTIVVYTSDHGDYMADHGLWCKGLPCFRSGYHVPAIVRWPEGIKNPGRTENSFVSLADFAPTFLEAAGAAPRTESQAFSGRSLMPFLKDRKSDGWRAAIFTQSNGNELYGIQRSVMTKEWKYVYNGFDYDELYNLIDDPDETVNRIDDPACREIVSSLCARMWTFAEKHKDTATNNYVMVALAPVGPASAYLKC